MDDDGGAKGAIALNTGVAIMKNKFKRHFSTQITAEKLKKYGDLFKTAHKTDECAPVTQYVREWTGDVCTDALARKRRADKPREKEWKGKVKGEVKHNKVPVKKQGGKKGKGPNHQHKQGPKHKPGSRPGSAKKK